jgi:hypothetical protein
MMTVSFQNAEEDFLEYHLYGASQSKTIMRRRNISRYLFAVLYVALGAYSAFLGSWLTGLVFIGLGVLWFALFPKLTANPSKKFYRKYIKEDYQPRIGKTTTLTIGAEDLTAVDRTSEVRTKISEIDKLIEAKRCLFLKLKSGSAFIPKSAVDTPALISAFTDRQIPVESDPDFVWK